MAGPEWVGLAVLRNPSHSEGRAGVSCESRLERHLLLLIDYKCFFLETTCSELTSRVWGKCVCALSSRSRGAVGADLM